LTHVTIAALAGMLFVLPSTGAQAQPPRQMGGQNERARQACDNAAAQAGYRVMRRDRENVNGNSYQLPMHVSHGSNESDITCSYDFQRRVANVPPWAGQTVANGPGSRYMQRAQRTCENYINQRRGMHVMQVGTPTQHGQRQWDVPVTVRRNGRGDETVTCRYNTANGKVSLH
jgi:hypothetical protein